MSVQDFIGLATKSLGVDEKTARSATGGLLSMLQHETAAEDFAGLKRALPGADSVLADFSGGGGGLIRGLAGAAAAAFGSKSGGSLGALAALGRSGLETGQIGPFVSLFLGFLKERGAADLVGRIARDVPQLAPFVGDAPTGGKA